MNQYELRFLHNLSIHQFEQCINNRLILKQFSNTSLREAAKTFSSLVRSLIAIKIITVFILLFNNTMIKNTYRILPNKRLSNFRFLQVIKNVLVQSIDFLDKIFCLKNIFQIHLITTQNVINSSKCYTPYSFKTLHHLQKLHYPK